MSIHEPWEFEHKRQKRLALCDQPQPQPIPKCESDHKFVRTYGGSCILCVRCNEQRGPFPTYVMSFGDNERAQFRVKKPDKSNEVRTAFCEMLLSLSLPLDHVDEFISIYDKNCKLRFRTRSLCAGVLFQWMNKHDTLAEFSRKCGVSKGTIAKICKQISNK